MARIRAVHPDLPSDRKVAAVSREARYTYVLTWCVADDQGLFRAEPRELLGQLYPHDLDIDGSHLEAWLSDLVGLGVLVWRWTHDGARVGELVNWPKRQKIDRPSRSFLASQLRPDAAPSPPPRDGLARLIRKEHEGLAARVLSPESRSPEPRVLSPESRVVGGSDDDLARVSRYTELQQRIPTVAHAALEGCVRAAQDPAAVVAAILAEGPDTGTNGAAGKTWAIIGQALLELRASSLAFRPVVFRSFVTRLVQDGKPQKGGDEARAIADRLELAAKGAG